MPKLEAVAEFLERFAPLELAEEWDNVGLLVGDRQAQVERVMTCLTTTQDVVQEAVQRQVQLIVTHHPLPFRPLQRITTETSVGRLLLQIIAAGMAVYSPHTALDSASAGINQRLAEGLQLHNIQPIHANAEDDPAVGSGRWGGCEPINLRQLANRVQRFLTGAQVRVVGDWDHAVQQVGVACGSGGSFLAAAAGCGCQALVTGETSFHTCLEAQSLNVGLVLTGHYASERFAVEQLADVLAREFPDLDVWASQSEQDPLSPL